MRRTRVCSLQSGTRSRSHGVAPIWYRTTLRSLRDLAWRVNVDEEACQPGRFIIFLNEVASRVVVGFLLDLLYFVTPLLHQILDSFL